MPIERRPGIDPDGEGQAGATEQPDRDQRREREEPNRSDPTYRDDPDRAGSDRDDSARGRIVLRPTRRGAPFDVHHRQPEKRRARTPFTAHDVILALTMRTRFDIFLPCCFTRGGSAQARNKYAHLSLTQAPLSPAVEIVHN